jgi:predicted lactoylglutathione lyase
VVDGSGSFRTFDIDSETFGPVINISDANGNISGTPAAVAASDGSLLVASSNRDHVYLVNASTGFATEVGREIPVAGGDLVFDAEGVLWYINRNTGTFYDVNGTDEFSVALSEINGAALLEDGSIILAEGDENGLMYGVDMVNQELDGNIYEVPLELFWGDLAGGCSVASSSSEPEMLISSEEFAQGWITAYPNPNEGMTAISFQTATKGDAVVEVFDLTGTKVDEVYSGFVSEETIYRLELNRPDLPNGVYLYRLTKADEVLMGKFIISK